jgi:hydrogenase expression/formation protein HypD
MMNELRDKRVIAALLGEIGQKSRSLHAPIRVMEVCGTHTMTIHKFGLKEMLEQNGVRMVSGPGCPVCITPNEIHEAAIRLLTEKEGLILATFGDMTRVPTRMGSLQTAIPAHRSEARLVYSPEESIDLALQNPDKEVVFFGVGFETTIPAIAVAAERALSLRLKNYSILSALWTIPPPLKTIVESGEASIQGFLYPGHVSVIIGREPYRFLAEKHGIPGVITGFEPADILLAVRSILGQILQKKPSVEIEYTRAVRPEGNRRALALMAAVLETKDAFWRGLGCIPKSGLRFRKRFYPWDAEVKHELSIRGGSGDLPGCRCGKVLRGLISPPECPLFGKTCNPDSPYGPCMVSYEGSCLIHFKYQKHMVRGKE